jgi:hypothetical protein
MNDSCYYYRENNKGTCTDTIVFSFSCIINISEKLIYRSTKSLCPITCLVTVYLLIIKFIITKIIFDILIVHETLNIKKRCVEYFHKVSKNLCVIIVTQVKYNGPYTAISGMKTANVTTAVYNTS